MVVGASKCGKSAFCKALVAEKGGFPEDYEPTCGSDYFMKNQKTTNGNFQFNFWDLSGDPDYVEVRNEFYKESQILLVMYDVTKKQTFDSMEEWFREATRHGGEHLHVFIVGTKTDLPGRAVKKETGQNYVKDRDQAGYYEVSAKEGKGFIALLSGMAEFMS